MDMDSIIRDMDKDAMSFFVCCIILLVTVSIVLLFGVRQTLQGKNEGIIQGFKGQTRMEKETMERIGSARSNRGCVPSAAEEQADADE